MRPIVPAIVLVALVGCVAGGYRAVPLRGQSQEQQDRDWAECVVTDSSGHALLLPAESAYWRDEAGAHRCLERKGYRVVPTTLPACADPFRTR